MRILPSGNWAKEWTSYDGVPATTYYRKKDIVRALKHYGHSGDELPTAAVNPYSDAAYLIRCCVEPYRIVYHA